MFGQRHNEARGLPYKSSFGPRSNFEFETPALNIDTVVVLAQTQQILFIRSYWNN